MTIDFDREDTGSHTEADAGAWATAHAEDDPLEPSHEAPTGQRLANLRAFEQQLLAEQKGR